jgi:hypothetical protein
VCGVCACDQEHSGRRCECSGNVDYSELEFQCKADNRSQVLCSGQGTCICGKCQCTTRPNPSEVSRILTDVMTSFHLSLIRSSADSSASATTSLALVATAKFVRATANAGAADATVTRAGPDLPVTADLPTIPACHSVNQLKH